MFVTICDLIKIAEKLALKPHPSRQLYAVESLLSWLVFKLLGKPTSDRVWNRRQAG